MEVSDEMLVLACRRNDQAAWEALIARYQRLIYSIPRRAGLNPEQTADVFQQVFAALLDHLHRIDRPDRISAWLVTTARRETWRVSRSQMTTGASVKTDEAEQQAAALVDQDLLPQEVVLEWERRRQVRQALSLLEDPCRTLLLMLFFSPEPPPYAQVAAALGTPEGSIGPMRARCLKKLARLLDETER